MTDGAVEILSETMPTQFPRALLVALEGIDGAGKTTQLGLLRRSLESAGETVVVSKEPTDGPWGRRIRESAATGRMPLGEELSAFIKDRTEHVEKLIVPSLRNGHIVLLDRYFYSTIAYQGARGADPKEIESQMTNLFPVPDAVFLLDIDPGLSLFRISHSRNETPNEFERLEPLRTARNIFLRLSGQHIFRIDGSMSPKLVHEEILQKFIDGPLKAKRCFKDYGCDDPLHCTWRFSGACEWWKMRSRLRSAYESELQDAQLAT